MTQDTLTAEEVAQFRKFMELEKIRKKKTLYSHHFDSLEFEKYSEIYTEDVVCELGPFGNPKGRAALFDTVKGLKAIRQPYYSFHAWTNIWIELTSPTTAMSRAYLFDINNDTNPRINPMNWLAVYDERWEKIKGDWLINHQKVQFIWPKRVVTDDFPTPMPTPTEI